MRRWKEKERKRHNDDPCGNEVRYVHIAMYVELDFSSDGQNHTVSLLKRRLERWSEREKRQRNHAYQAHARADRLPVASVLQVAAMVV